MPAMKLTGFDVGAGLLVGLQALDRVVEVRIAAQEILAARRQGEADAERARRLGRRRDALDRLAEIVERPVLVAGRVLDRAADQAGRAGQPHGLGGEARRMAEAVLEIGRDRQLDRVDHGARMRQRLVARDLAVAPSERARAGAARGRQRAKAEPGQHARRAGVPRVGNQEGAGSLVQRPERGGLVALAGGHLVPPLVAVSGSRAQTSASSS
jgi:hypothetical protein